MNVNTILALIEMATKLASGMTSGKPQVVLEQVAALEAMARKVSQAHQELVGKPIDPASLTHESRIV